MQLKYLFLSMLIVFLTGCQSYLARPLPLTPDFGRLVVFDGGEVIQGKGFALPRGVSKLEISYEKPQTHKTHLLYDLKFRNGWTGGGWNWYAWDGDGNDISGFKNLVLSMAVFGGNISDITFQLTSKNSSGEPDGMGAKVSLYPFISKQTKYVKLTIPIEKLKGGNLDEKKVWGFNLGVFSGSGKGDCKIYLDQIEFTQ